YVFSAVQDWMIPPGVKLPDLLPFESRTSFRHMAPPGWVQELGIRLAKFFNRFGPGYATKSESGELVLRPGHAQNLLWLALTLIGYLGFYAWVYLSHDVPDQGSYFPALFYALGVLLLLLYLLTGAAYLLDYYRIPVLAGLSLVSLLLFWNTD